MQGKAMRRACPSQPSHQAEWTRAQCSAACMGWHEHSMHSMATTACLVAQHDHAEQHGLQPRPQQRLRQRPPQPAQQRALHSSGSRRASVCAGRCQTALPAASSPRGAQAQKSPPNPLRSTRRRQLNQWRAAAKQPGAPGSASRPDRFSSPESPGTPGRFLHLGAEETRAGETGRATGLLGCRRAAAARRSMAEAAAKAPGPHVK